MHPAPSGAHENGERLRWKEGAGFPAPIMVDVRRRKLAIIAMNVSVLAAALSWLLVLFSVMYSAAAVPWALGVAIVLTVICAYALYRYYSKYSERGPGCARCARPRPVLNPPAAPAPHGGQR